jgi:uncharacterized DUF497 family protein
MARDDDELHFCWDESKAASNLGRHGVSFEAASFVFDDPRRLEWEDVFARGEYRNIVVGQVDGVVLTVVYAVPEDDLCRIISARVATAHERKAYEQNLFQA